MSCRALDVPAPVRAKARAVGALSWLEGLADAVADLEREWAIRVGLAYQDSTEAFVARASTANGTPAVLKLMVPRDGDHATLEITVLQLADGRGCARLLRADPAHGAMLVERLGPTLHSMRLPLVRRHEIMVSLASRMWRPAAGYGLPTGAGKAAWLAKVVVADWAELDRPCSAAAVDHAVACAERRAGAHDDERAVLVHGDVHQWNTLLGPDGWALVDPDGLLAEPECDLGVLMREDPEDLLDCTDPYRRARWLAARTGRDPVAIWEWGVAKRLSTGLLAERVGLQPVGRRMLAVADRFAGLPGP